LREAAGLVTRVLEAALSGSNRSGVGWQGSSKWSTLARDPRHPYRIGGRYCRRSDTGRRDRDVVAVGARGVDMLAWENFGEGWVADVAQLDSKTSG